MFKIIKKRMYFFLYMFFFLVVQCAYFNTFYNAEKYFESALSIIQKAPALNDSKIPSNAIDLLDKAILNSNTIVKKYSDSKYVPEAYFLMGVSYFYKESYSSAIENFNLIDLDSFKRPNQLRLWLAYAFLRINDNDQFNKYMNKLVLNDLSNEDKYLYYNIKAESYELENDMSNAYKTYSLAADITALESRKIYLYRKLINISEQSSDLMEKTRFIKLLEEYVVDVNEMRNLKLDWLDSKDRLGHYEDIILEVDDIVDDSNFQSIKAKLMLYKSKAYRKINKLGSAKDLLIDIIDQFSKRDESSEAYYILGDLALSEDFDLDKSKEFFQKSIDEKSRSKYGKKSKLIKNKIENYQELIEDYSYFSENLDIDPVFEDQNSMNIDLPKVDSGILLDSLLFKIGETLYFDFAQIDSALNRYNYILEKYPNSKYKKQLLGIIDYHKNFESFKNDKILLNDNGYDAIQINRDKGLDLPLIDAQLNYYNSLYNDYNDSIALFNVAYIKDNFLYDVYSALKIYNKINKEFKRHPNKDYINTRLNKIQRNVEEAINYYDVKFEICLAFDLIKKDDLDSARQILREIKITRKNSDYKFVNDLIKNIDVYSEIDSVVDSSLIRDSLIFKMAEIEYYYFDKKGKSLDRLEDIINNNPNSEYKNQILWMMSKYKNSYNLSTEDNIDYTYIDSSKVDFIDKFEDLDISKIKLYKKRLDEIYFEFDEKD